MTAAVASPPRPPRRRVALFVLIPLLALLAWGGVRHWQTHRLAVDTAKGQRDYVPSVRTARAQRVDTPVELVQPGQTEAFDVANLYPRATGYIAERLVDIGSRVHKGDLLLRIAAPDLDQQLAQAQAQLGQTQAAIIQAQAALQQAQANTHLATVTKYRETTLAREGWETRQNADNSTANASVNVAGVTNAQAGIAVAIANLHSQQATVQRLQALAAFERVSAPFDGVITVRNVDTGDLLAADSAGGAPMLSIARDDVLRVAVYVPQSGAIGLHDGLPAEVSVPELPGRSFEGHVSRSAHSLNAASRSMLTEVDIDNRAHVLRPGLYVQVRFAIPREQPGVVVPDEALVFNAAGLQVAVVGEDEHVHFRKVAIYRDFGTSAELRDGLAGDEQLVLSPPADLREGGRVHLAKPVPPAGEQVSQAQ